jgi:hypothetical protein
MENTQVNLFKLVKAGEILFVGITKSKLLVRLALYKSQTAKFSTQPFYEYFINNGWDDVSIELIETVNKDESKARLNTLITELSPPLNKVEIVSEDEKKLKKLKKLEYQKAYNKNNQIYIKKYYEDHKEELKLKSKKRYEMLKSFKVLALVE